MNKPEESGLTSKSVREYLDVQLRYTHDDHRHPSNTQAVIDKQHESIVAAVRDESRSRKIHFLDVGCGWGDFSNQLDPYLTDYVGVEPSAIELGQFRKRPGRHVVRGIGENLSFLRPRSRNVILLNSVLDHCVDWRKTFDNCLRVLCPGGLMIISMENGEKLVTRAQKALRLEAPHEGHLAFFTYSIVEELLEKEKFTVERKRTMGYLFGFHQLTKAVPIPKGIMRPINRLVDVMAHPFFPRGGQILFFTARSPRAADDTGPCEQPFQCPRCQSVWIFGRPQCESCGMQMKYIDGDTLDALAFTNAEQIIEEKLGQRA